ncbi:MAG: hypothetical protein ACI9S8_000311 [Chlamydiales bacterium]|jgi:hypothetical protein
MELGRETRDLDFLVRKLKNESETLQKVFNEIATIDLQDHFSFSDVEIDPLTHFHMLYPGTQVSLKGNFGNTRFKITIDLGFGDLVDPIEREIELTHLNNDVFPDLKIELSCYPPEFIFAEKLETVVSRGGSNSRMKDFFDLFLMTKETGLLEANKTKQVIETVFSHREIPLELPINFNEEETNTLQEYWKPFLSKLHPTLIDEKSLPVNIEDLIKVINEFLKETIFLN